MNPLILEILDGLEWHQTGSRYYGNSTPDSDWDILIADVTVYSIDKKIREIILKHKWSQRNIDDMTYFAMINDDVSVYITQSYITSYLNDVFTIVFKDSSTFPLREETYQLLLPPYRSHYDIWVMISNYIKHNIDSINISRPESLRVKDFFNILRKYIIRKVEETKIDTTLLVNNDDYVSECVNELNHLFAQLTS